MHEFSRADFEKYRINLHNFYFRMANKGEGTTTTPMPYPPECYYKHYTNANVRKGNAPQPPKIPLGAVSVFGQPQVSHVNDSF